jgi:RNA polymerase sigma-70 factor, ECF subfamily
VNSLSDADLIQGILAGERDLYAVIVGRYQESLYRFAYGMLQDSDLAADVVQDSFVKAYASLAGCRDRSQFRAWIFRIVRNRCTDHLRAPARNQVGLEANLPDLRIHHTPESEFERRELRRRLTEALTALPAAQREAFLLKHVENLSYEEMAETLQIGTSALKMRVMRAREALQESLREAGISGTLSV